MLQYDAVGISAYDLAAGVDFLKEVGERSKVPWLSANILRRSNQQPIFKPAISKTIGAVQVGIIGITNPAARNLNNEEITIVPWQQTLPGLVAEMKSSCDLLILLSSLPPQENQQIAQEINGIHIILQNGTQNRPVQKIRNTLITNTGKRGKYLGELNINWLPVKKWGLSKKEQLHPLRQKLDQINWRLKRLKRKGLPDKGAENNPHLLEDFHRLVASQKQLLETIATLENKKDEEFCSFRNRFVALEKNLVEQPAVQAVIDNARTEVNKAGKKRRNASRLPSLYLGPNRCAPCHPDQTASWRNSRHAKSYQTLARKNQQFNLACLPCHVTGIEASNPQQALTLPGQLQVVGCEACHGTGSEHVKKQGRRPMPAPIPTAETCLRCHTPDHSDDFDYQRDRQRVHSRR